MSFVVCSNDCMIHYVHFNDSRQNSFSYGISAKVNVKTKEKHKQNKLFSIGYKMSTAPKRSRATAEQINHMVDFFINNPGLAGGKFQKLHGKFEFDKKWSELTTNLNSLGGTVKSVEQWRTVWRDLKSRTSIKVRDKRKQEARTGNRPINGDPLTECEKKVISIIGKEYIEGHSNVKENIPMDEDSQLLLEEENIILEMSPSSGTADVIMETPKSLSKIPNRKRLKRKNENNEETKDKFLEIAKKQAECLKMLAESNAGNVEATKIMAEAIKTMGEGLKTMGEGLKTMANSINNLADCLNKY